MDRSGQKRQKCCFLTQADFPDPVFVLPGSEHVLLSKLSQKRAAERKTQRERTDLWGMGLNEVGGDGIKAQAEKSPEIKNERALFP